MGTLRKLVAAGRLPSHGGRRTLSALHDGQVVALSVASRSAAFDVDLGSDAAGKTVATYSRCTRAVAPPVDFRSARHRGCRIRVLDLTSGQERSAGIPRPDGASDTMGSMWRGRIAFARSRPRGDVDQVMLWDPARKRMRTLKHGSVPTKCIAYQIAQCPRTVENSGQVSALDLGARMVAFRRNVSGESVIGHAASELRASTLDGRRSILLQGGYVYEADSVTTFSLGRPTVTGAAVWFSTEAVRCETSRVELNRVRIAPYRPLRGPHPGQHAQVRDHAGRCPRRQPHVCADRPTADREAACPCALKSLAVPWLMRSTAARTRPSEY